MITILFTLVYLAIGARIYQKWFTDYSLFEDAGFALILFWPLVAILFVWFDVVFTEYFKRRAGSDDE